MMKTVLSYVGIIILVAIMVAVTTAIENLILRVIKKIKTHKAMIKIKDEK